MEHHEQDRFEQLYAQHLIALKLQGKRSKTIDGYARAVRRIAGFFNCCPDNLTVAARKDDAPAAHYAALTKIAGRGPCSDGGGLIHTTSG